MAFGSFNADESGDKRTSYCLVGAVFKFGVKRLRPSETYSVGRDPRSRIHLPSDTVSRRHAVIRWTDEVGGGFVIQDLGSRNGVRVNGEWIKKQKLLQDEDLISINPFNLRYRVMAGDLDLIMLSESAGSEETRPLEAETEGLAMQGAAAAGASSGGPDAQLSGRFLGHELVEICQLIVQNQRSGVLEVKGSLHGGTLQFNEGELVKAEASRLKGEDAARALLTIPSGAFTFSRQGKVEADGDPVPLQQLLGELSGEQPKGEDHVGGSTTVIDVHKDTAADG